MEYADYEEHVGTDTTGRYDVTPLFEDSALFSELVADLLEPVDLDAVTHVASLDALGFVIGGYAAACADCGFVPVRKGGKLPYPDDGLLRRTVTDHSDEEKTPELNSDALDDGDRVLFVDDWIETGAQMRAATDLVESAGATVEAVSVLFAGRNDATEPLFDGYDVYAIGTDD
jgi:adenine phosphoribosyltransferase